MIVRPSSLRGILRFLAAHALACQDEALDDPKIRDALLDFTGRCDGFRCSRRFHYEREKGDTWVTFAVALAERKGDVIKADCEDLAAYYAAAILLLTADPALAPEHPLRAFVDGSRPFMRISPSGTADAHAYFRQGANILDPSVWHGMAAPGDTFYRRPDSLEIST